VPSQQLETVIQMLRARPAREGLTLEEQRAGFDVVAKLFPIAPDVRREPVNAGGVKAEWLEAPGAAGNRTVLYLHGGGYVLGSLDTHRQLAARISRAAITRCLSVDYRLAPEHPFPAAVEDATTAYRWLLGTGVEPARVVIAGDSAGGGLTVATLLALREAGTPLPAGAVCLSPWVDLEGTGESTTTKADVDPIIETGLLNDMGRLYLGGADPRTPLAAPLYADLHGLPPLLIQVGTAEALLDDSTRLAERARAAGVDVTLDPWEDMIHVWQFFAEMLPEGQEAIDRIGEFIRKRLS
jgi:acetyl esterase/lipase